MYSSGDDLGWEATAFTSRPAIIVKGVAFNATEERKELFFVDKTKYRIAAPAMIPMEIYRNDDEDGEYYVEFTEKEIEKIHKKFMKNIGKNKGLFNLEHNPNEIVPAFVLETWIVDNPEKDKSFSTFGVKVPKGTLFMVAQVTDKEYYNQLVENGQTGFSIEGFLGLALSEIKNKINKETKMEEKKINLPEGAKFQIKDKWYEVKDGKVIEVIEVEKEVEASDEVKEEEKVELADEIKEVEASDEVKEEEKVELADEVKEEVSPSYTKEEIDVKFDELFKLIADLSKVDVIEDTTIEEVKLSAHDRLAEFVRFNKK